MKGNKISIRDVAKEANVSISTVSRVLRKYSNVPPETEEIVMKAVNKLKYIPNVAAQSLSHGSMQNIGVVFTRSAENAFSNPFYADVLRGIGNVTEKYGYNIQLISYSDLYREKEESIKLLRSGRVDGLILLSSRIYDSLIHDLLSQELKFVLSGRVLENTLLYDKIFSVNTDNLRDSYNAVRHLIDMDHEKIAIVTAPMEYVVSKDRYDGYRQALLSGGIEFDPELEINGGYTLGDAKEAVKEKLSRRKDITAIFATDDLKAVAVIKAANELGFRVPDDIAVIGYNDFEVATIVEPNLTTVRVPIFELGRESANMLIHILKGEDIEVKNKIIPTEFIIRDSCGYRKKGL
ncbi:MAG TPA: LacI family DNA-binding transcriptional regulator [Clostridia bacterium]|nr:LacI family DNA-binding transcriptional regulator [Clostridia bacterium]